MSSSSQFPDPATRELAPIADATALPMPRLIEWRPWVHSTNSSLAGHATVAFPGGWTIGRIPIFRAQNGDVSAGVPSIPEIDSDGRVRTRPDGSRAYSPVIAFANAAAKLRWQRAVLGALSSAGVLP